MPSNKLFLICYFLLSVFVITNCSKSQEKCKEYKELFKEYRDPTFIPDVRSKPTLTPLGKEPTEYGEFPHMVALLFNGSKSLEVNCGGVLISERYILSTASCEDSASSRKILHARLGDHNIRSDTDDKNVQEIKVKKTIPHPGWIRPRLYNDIMLIELAEPVKFNEYVRPACLYTKMELPSDAEISATGWGVLEYFGNQADILHKVYLDIFSNEECNDAYNSTSRRMLTNGIDDKIMICAGGKTTPKDTCQGDTGGPLQFYNKDFNNYEIVGLTSFGKGCGVVGVPAVLTRVSEYVPWIEDIVWKD